MPIYEYECHDCRRIVSRLVLRPSVAEPPTCPRCKGSSLTRVMSRFATVKSEEARLEAMAEDPGLADIDENDPASVARFMKRMGREFGDELGEDFDEAVEEAMEEGAGEAGDEESGGEFGSSAGATSGAADDEL